MRKGEMRNGVEIVFTQGAECPECDVYAEVDFPTGAYDEDGLTDVHELSREVVCHGCGHKWQAEYEGWTSFGEAG